MTEEAKPATDRNIRSVEISFSITDVLQEEGDAGVTTLANELNHSKSTIHSHLKTLDDLNIIVKEGGEYRLSLRLLDIANHVRNNVGNYDVIQEEVDALADETGEIAQFGIEEHGKVSYFYKAEGEESVVTASRVGTQQPMYSTSLGKTILAYLPDARTKEIVDQQEFEPLTESTISSKEELYADLEAIRERGYGIDDEENYEGLRCVSAPVRSDDTVLGAISVTGPSSRFTHEKIESSLSDKVLRAANVIELNTKFS